MIETDVVLQLQIFHLEKIKESDRNWRGITITNELYYWIQLYYCIIIVLQLQIFHVEQVNDSDGNWRGITITNFSRWTC